ncbi:MAG: hypothetical protein IT423_09225, partial [Pirellulaceae bacterium]|nr:hypothetical protein [Pirellulaceae bacterium]
MADDLTRVGLTIGDPAGVGPEIVLNVMRDAAVAAKCQLVVFGDRSVLERCAAVTNQPL